jgi:hypothetical protein
MPAAVLCLSQTVINPPAMDISRTKYQETRDLNHTHPQPKPQPTLPVSSIHPTAPSIPTPLFVAKFSQTKHEMRFTLDPMLCMAIPLILSAAAIGSYRPHGSEVDTGTP